MSTGLLSRKGWRFIRHGLTALGFSWFSSIQQFDPNLIDLSSAAL